MRNACDSDSRCGLVCDASTCDSKSLAMWVERCRPLSPWSTLIWEEPCMDQYTSLRGNFRRTFSAIGPKEFPWKNNAEGAIGRYEFPPWNSYGPMAPKSLWQFRSTPASVHRVLFSAHRGARTSETWEWHRGFAACHYAAARSATAWAQELWLRRRRLLCFSAKATRRGHLETRKNQTCAPPTELHDSATSTSTRPPARPVQGTFVLI